MPRLEAPAVAPGGVEVAVVGPGERPVVAAVAAVHQALARYLRSRRPLDALDDGARLDGRQDGAGQWGEDVVGRAAPVRPPYLAAVAHDDQAQRGDDEQRLVAGAGAREGIQRQPRPDAVVVRPPAEAGGRPGIAGRALRQGRVGVRRGERHHRGGQQLAPLPLAPPQHQAPQPGGRPRGELPAAPVGNQWQAVHLIGRTVADGPLPVRYADGPHDALAQQPADVLLRRVAEGDGHHIGQHPHPGVAVGVGGTRFEDHGRPVAGDGEGVGLVAPEGALPAGQGHVLVRQRLAPLGGGSPLLLAQLGVLDAGGVRGQVADGDAGLQRVRPPLRDVVAGQVIHPEQAVVERQHEGEPADEGLGHRGAVVAPPGAEVGRVPLLHDAVLAQDQQRLRAVLRQPVAHGLQPPARHTHALRRRALPLVFLTHVHQCSAAGGDGQRRANV